ncbi:MAG: hypothetical protein ABJH07_00635 [Sedimentitalea sp.]|uniref:hypothetical protein n=1 Tax=Sedimentitalea sp. TaxID=2048915 RepID=UPI0032650450
MYKRGFKLEEFSAYHLLNDERSAAALREYYTAFARLAVKLGTPFIFDSLTYHASRDWGALLGYSTEGLAEMNHKCLDLYSEQSSASASSLQQRMEGAGAHDIVLESKSPSWPKTDKAFVPC